MENMICHDIGEEIILKLKELNLLLEKKLKKIKDEKKLQSEYVNGN